MSIPALIAHGLRNKPLENFDNSNEYLNRELIPIVRAMRAGLNELIEAAENGELGGSGSGGWKRHFLHMGG